MISPIDQESAQQIFSEDLPLPKPLPREKQEEFLAHAYIKVRKEQEQAYKLLLAKHHNVFSTDKNYLDWANDFEHKITKTDEEVIQCHTLIKFINSQKTASPDIEKSRCKKKTHF
jgi:hypothetical protein